MSQYDDTDREKAFLLWKERGLSMREIAQQDDMPTRETVRKWAKEDNWRERKAKMREQALEEVKDELDLPSAEERERNELRWIYQKKKELAELIQSGELEKADTDAEAIRQWKELNEASRLIEGEATSITEDKSRQSNISLNKIARYLNIEDPQQIVRAAEESIMEGDSDVEE